MNTLHLLVLVVMLFPAALFSQENSVAAFQQQHPHLLFIERGDLGNFPASFLAEQHDNVIVYDGEIKPEDLQKAAQHTKGIQAPVKPPVDTEAQFIKNWVGDHQDVVIITRSKFNELTQEEQQNCLNNHALILAGDTITAKDIQLFQ